MVKLKPTLIFFLQASMCRGKFPRFLSFLSQPVNGHGNSPSELSESRNQISVLVDTKGESVNEWCRMTHQTHFAQVGSVSQ